MPHFDIVRDHSEITKSYADQSFLRIVISANAFLISCVWMTSYRWIAVWFYQLRLPLAGVSDEMEQPTPATKFLWNSKI